MQKPFALLALTAGLLPQTALAQPVQWAPVEGSQVRPAAPVVWEVVPNTAPAQPQTPVSWEVVPPGEENSPLNPITPPPNSLADQQPKAPEPYVTGGLYQVKRGNEWLPSISQRVPNAYGSTFGTLQTGLFVESCNVTGAYVCGTKSFSQEFNSNAKGIWSFLLGLGDPRKAIGVDLGFQITSLATTRPDSSTEGTPFGSGQGIDLAISRNFSENVSLKLGVNNLIKVDDIQQIDQPSSAYGVVSARFDLGGRPDDNSNDLYVTLGAANGLYRPLNAIVEDQGRACAAERAEKGRNSTGYDGNLWCNIWGFSYGAPYPVASVAYMVNPQFSLIAEWWGRNLTLAASIKPIDGLNWVITPGITNLIKNADWDPAIPGYTTTPRFQLTTSIGF